MKLKTPAIFLHIPSGEYYRIVPASKEMIESYKPIYTISTHLLYRGDSPLAFLDPNEICNEETARMTIADRHSTPVQYPSELILISQG